jgi:transcriptional regulator with XRE-family HTH domain
MITGNSFSQPAGIESADTSSIKQQILNNLQASREYRRAFIEENIRTRITAQIHALRTKEEWDYKQFAEKINKKTSWAYRLEDPNEPPLTIPSLLEVAEAFDIGLDVRFRPFSELLTEVTTLTPTSFLVPSFEAEVKAGAFFKSRRTRRVRGSNHRHRFIYRKRLSKQIGDPHRDSNSEYIGTGLARDDGIGDASILLPHAS